LRSRLRIRLAAAEHARHAVARSGAAAPLRRTAEVRRDKGATCAAALHRPRSTR
jgi:hypothetical protein